MQTGGLAGSRVDPADVARYIEQLSREMKDMALRADLGFLSYLLALVEGDAAATAEQLEQTGFSRGLDPGTSTR